MWWKIELDTSRSVFLVINAWNWMTIENFQYFTVKGGNKKQWVHMIFVMKVIVIVKSLSFCFLFFCKLPVVHNKGAESMLSTSWEWIFHFLISSLSRHGMKWSIFNSNTQDSQPMTHNEAFKGISRNTLHCHKLNWKSLER